MTHAARPLVRWILAVTVLVAAALVVLHPRSEPGAQPRAPLHPPPAVFLEGTSLGTSTEVLLRSTGGTTPVVKLGEVAHAPGSSARAVLYQDPSDASKVVVFVVVREDEARVRGFHSALFRVEDGRVTRLAGDLVDVSAPLLTESGLLLVRRGVEGASPEGAQEREDALTIDAVDPRSGLARTVWRGAGQTAFLAAPLHGSEALVYHVAEDGARLFALDAGTGSTRSLAGPWPPLARDFSFDPIRDDAVYTRVPNPGCGEHEIAALSVSQPGAEERVLYRAPSDVLMPRALRDGKVALSLPSEGGLALLAHASGSEPVRMAPLGAGTDAVVGESADGRWLAVRHTKGDEQVHALVERETGRFVTVARPGRVVRFVGFVEPRTDR